MAYYVVAYDISDDKRRRKVGEALEAFGKRVNYSVFEVQVTSKAQLKALEQELLKELDGKHDSLRFYHVCQSCVEKSWSLGDEPPPFEESAVYFF